MLVPDFLEPACLWLWQGWDWEVIGSPKSNAWVLTARPCQWEMKEGQGFREGPLALNRLQETGCPTWASDLREGPIQGTTHTRDCHKPSYPPVSNRLRDPVCPLFRGLETHYSLHMPSAIWERITRRGENVSLFIVLDWATWPNGTNFNLPLAIHHHDHQHHTSSWGAGGWGAQSGERCNAL